MLLERCSVAAFFLDSLSVRISWASGRPACRARFLRSARARSVPVDGRLKGSWGEDLSSLGFSTKWDSMRWNFGCLMGVDTTTGTTQISLGPILNSCKLRSLLAKQHWTGWTSLNICNSKNSLAKQMTKPTHRAIDYQVPPPHTATSHRQEPSNNGFGCQVLLVCL